jgi:hypothetical protein
MPTTGDYLVNLHVISTDSGGNSYAIVVGGSVTNAGAGKNGPGPTTITTGTLSGYTMPIPDPFPQGTEEKESVGTWILHLNAGDQLTVINVGSSAANVGSAKTGGIIIATINFELLRAGP